LGERPSSPENGALGQFWDSQLVTLRDIEGKEQPYPFGTPEQLIEDFLADVRRLRGER
jgi:hypothetical protein